MYGVKKFNIILNLAKCLNLSIQRWGKNNLLFTRGVPYVPHLIKRNSFSNSYIIQFNVMQKSHPFQPNGYYTNTIKFLV